MNNHQKNLFFNHFLREQGVSGDLRSLLYHIARSIKYINFSLRSGNTMKAKTSNASGEEQMALDVLSDQIIMDELTKSDLACMMASEEQDEAIPLTCSRCGREKFAISYDPLDGSSLVDANLAIGSIFGIWKDCGNFLGCTGQKLVASAYAVYGPRVTFTVAIKGKGTHEFELNDVGEFILTRKNITLTDNTKYFGPGNLRATQHDEKYLAYVNHCMTEQRTLRYSGGMVPDLHHILCKEQGVFTYPKMIPKYPNGKLRLLFECAPFSMIFEEAGGIALDQEGTRILDQKIEDIHQRTPIFIGSKNSVTEAVEFLQ